MTGLPDNHSHNDVNLDAGLTGHWFRFRDDMVGKVDVLRQAAAARASSDDADLRRAREQAHSLAGGLGMFGLTEPARIAARLEDVFAGEEHLDSGDVAELVEALADAVIGFRPAA